MDNKQITTYPHFAPNQVLTDKQLNGLHAFLDGQNRLTRTHGIGAGIVCGLWAKYRYETACKEHYIDLSPGYGFSSQGYYIELAAKEEEAAVATPAPAKKSTAKQPCGTPTYTKGRTYTHVRPYYLPQQDPFGDASDYAAWAETSGTTPPNIWELLTAEEAITASHALPLDETFVSGRVLLLYLEQSAGEDKPCVNLDCKNDEQVVYTVRALLVEEALFTKAKVCEGIQDKLLHLPRFFTQASLPESSKLQKRKTQAAKAVSSLGSMTNIRTYDDINAAYGALVENIVGDLSLGINTSFGTYDTFLNLACEVDIDALLDRLGEIITGGRFDVDYHQYHYDFVRDLVYAYNEFLTEACKLTGDCWPVKGFPRHLGIAHLLSDGDKTVKVTTHGYRHTFKASAVRNVMHGDWGRVRKMFLRIRDLIQGFAFDAEFKALIASEVARMPIYITPSQTETYALGRRAIPYYYGDAETPEAFEHNWQPTECCTGEVLLGYAYQKEDGEAIQEVPLEYNLLNKSFLRIEGHIGKRLIKKQTGGAISLSDEIQRVIEIRNHYNLEFDLVLVNLANGTNNTTGNPSVLGTSPEGAFLIEDPDFFSNIQSKYDWAIGLEHSGGATHGGTFIIVFDYVCVDEKAGTFETIAVADFSLNKSVACCMKEERPAEVKCPELTDISVTPKDLTDTGRIFDLTAEVTGSPVSYQWFIEGKLLDPPQNTQTITQVLPFTTSGAVLVSVIITGPGTCTDKFEKRIIVQRDQPVPGIIAAPVVEVKSRSLNSDPTLAARAAVYREKLFALNAKGEFQSSGAYTAALDFVGANVGFTEALPHYRDASNKLMLAFTRSKDNKKQAIREMIEQTTLRLLDLASQEQTISPETFAVIAGQIEKIKPSGLTSSRIRTNWKGSDLGNSATLTALNQLLK